MKSSSHYFGALSEEPDDPIYTINQTFDADPDAEVERLDREEYDISSSPLRRYHDTPSKSSEDILSNSSSRSQDFDCAPAQDEEEEVKSDGGLSELSNEERYFQSKSSFQRQALFTKNLTLQLRSKTTNCMQICVPLVGLLMAYLLAFVIDANIGDLKEQSTFIPVPQIFQMNLQPLVNLVPDLPLSIDNCEKWFVTEFAPNATQETKQYWGSNTGTPWVNQKGFGLLEGRKNILQ